MIKFAFGLLLGLYTSNGYYKQNKYMAYTIAEYQRTVGIYKHFLKTKELDKEFDMYVLSLGKDIPRQLCKNYN